MKQVVLLDTDVIFKSTPLRNYTNHRKISLVKKLTGIRNPIKAIELQKSLHESTGNTLLGLNLLGYDITHQQYNNYVYDNPNVMGRVDKKHLVDLKKRCDQASTDLYVFSDIPRQWIQRAIGDDIPILDLPHPKYKLDCYSSVEKFAGNDAHINCVESCMFNLLPILNNPKWSAFLVKDDIHLRNESNIINNFNIVTGLDDIVAS